MFIGMLHNGTGHRRLSFPYIKGKYISLYFYKLRGNIVVYFGTLRENIIVYFHTLRGNMSSYIQIRSGEIYCLFWHIQGKNNYVHTLRVNNCKLILKDVGGKYCLLKFGTFRGNIMLYFHTLRGNMSSNI